MEGQARAPAAGTVLNALATGFGSAFAIDAHTTATVELHDVDGGAGAGRDTDGGTDGGAGAGVGNVTGEVADEPDADTRLVERCVELVVARYGDGEGGHVRTESEVPMASGLKSSSAAANATVAATLDALGVDLAEDTDTDEAGDGTRRNRGKDARDRDRTGSVGRTEAARIGVRAARDAGVTVTGAFDDASASMLGGVTVTDNAADELLVHEAIDWDVLVWTPPERAFSTDADVKRCERIAPVADLVKDLALDGAYARAMTVNGLAFCAALGFPAEPLVEALPAASGASLSGTGPSFAAVGECSALERVRDTWDRREGDTWLTTTQTTGTRTT